VELIGFYGFECEQNAFILRWIRLFGLISNPSLIISKPLSNVIIKKNP
jgi:hypothetical protein